MQDNITPGITGTRKVHHNEVMIQKSFFLIMSLKDDKSNTHPPIYTTPVCVCVFLLNLMFYDVLKPALMPVQQHLAVVVCDDVLHAAGSLH